jgi:hypothetical protein
MHPKGYPIPGFCSTRLLCQEVSGVRLASGTTRTTDFGPHRPDCGAHRRRALCIGMHAMHDAHRVRCVLPRELIHPRNLYQNRTARHHAIAVTLHVQMVKKRAEMAAKTKATKAKNAVDRKEVTARAAKRPRVEDSDLELNEVDEGDEDAMDVV